METSSVVEGSFSAFNRAFRGMPRSFVGVIQQHVKKDNEKLVEEQSSHIQDLMRAHNSSLQATRSVPMNMCAKVFSYPITEDFAVTNTEAQNYKKSKLQASRRFQY